MSGFAREDGVARTATACPSRRRPARYGTPLYVYSRAAVEAAYRAYDRAFARRAAPHLLRAQGQRLAAPCCACWPALGRGRRHRLRRRAAGRAARRASRPSASCSPGWGRPTPRSRSAWSAASASSTRRARTRSRASRRPAARAGARRARHPARQPRHRRRARTRTSRPGCARTSSAWTSREAPGDPRRARARLPGDRGQRRAVPHRLADHGPRARWREAARELAALSRRAAGRGLRAADDRHRRRARASTTTGDGAPPVGGARGARCCPLLEGLPLTLLLEPGRSLVARGGRAAHARAVREGEPRQAVRDRGRGHERPAAPGALPGATTASSPCAARGAPTRAVGRGGPGVRERRLPGPRPRAARGASRATCWPCATRAPTASPWPRTTTCGPRAGGGAGGRRRGCASSGGGRPSRIWSAPKWSDAYGATSTSSLCGRPRRSLKTIVE